MSEWKSMDSAPKDGRRILLSRRKPPRGNTVNYRYVVIGRWRGRSWATEITANLYFVRDEQLLGWLPLPTPAPIEGVET